MPRGQVLEFSGVTKRFSAITAVSHLSGRVEPGVVTGFLGPNGAGKTTSLRILLGLVRASEGTATIGGAAYADLRDPLRSVGAALEASSFHPGRTAADHLRVYASAAGIPRLRVDEVLGLVGLADAAGRKVGGFSLGMRQRLGLASALLGDPGVLVLDEPANGLDPEGIRWMRGFLRELAREGRTVLISSHLLSEVQQTVDAILVIAQGRLVFQGGLDELADPAEYATVVDAPDRAALARALDAAGMPYELLRSGLTVRGSDPAQVGAAAAAGGVALSALQRRGSSLEEVFLQLVSGERVHVPAVAVGTDGQTVAPDDAPDGAPDDAPEADPTGAPAADPDAGPTGDDPADTGAEPLVADGPADDGASSGDSAAAEAVALAAALDAETGVLPGAASATGAAVWSGLLDDPDTAHDSSSGERPTDAAAPAGAAFAVARTGVIDIVPGADDPWDEGRTVSEVADGHRPGGPKTESDQAADAFFAAFDGHGASGRDGDGDEAPVGVVSEAPADADASAEASADPGDPPDAPPARHPHDRDGGERR